MTTTMVKLVCAECGHENEPERIYCHSCGMRLDRSAVVSKKSVQEGLKETQRRVRRIFDPTRVKIRLWFFRTAKLVLGACATAALIQMFSPPDVPAPVKPLLLPSQLNFDLENAVNYHRPAQLHYSEDQVNAYLGYALKIKQNSLDKPLLDFRRVVVGFGEGAVNVTAERAFFGFSIYSGSSYQVKLQGGKLVASNNGGSIGRIPVHPVLMQVMDVIFVDVWSALERERKLVSKMNTIEFHPKSVVLTAPPG
ncbi:MAG: zinc ribbon domain-containing protein [Chthoniobacterales bacterium]